MVPLISFSAGTNTKIKIRKTQRRGKIEKQRGGGGREIKLLCRSAKIRLCPFSLARRATLMVLVVEHREVFGQWRMWIRVKT
jgi:hypothetical protein